MARVLVLCHTVFNDVWRTDYGPTENQPSAKFLARYLIEKQASGDDDDYVAVTSEQVLEAISENLPNQGIIGSNPAQLVMVLRNMLLTFDTKVKDLNESVIIIADMLSSRGFEVVMVTNMNKKIKHIVDFYQKHEKTSKQWQPKHIESLFSVLSTSQLEKFLRDNDKEMCDLVDVQLTGS